MKLNSYEIPLGTDGRTVEVSTINIFDNNQSLINNGYIPKKIKTKKEQVDTSSIEFIRSIALNKKDSVTSIPSSIIVDAPKEEEIKENVSRRYSFEKETEEKIVEPSVTTLYQRPLQDNAYRNNSMYNSFYDKLDPIEKLKEDLGRAEVGTYAYKVLSIGVKKVEKFDILLEENDREVVNKEAEIKKLQEELDKLKAERVTIEKEKRDNANIVADAAKQAAQLDNFDKATKEADLKREQEEEKRRAQEKAEKEAAIARRAEMLARIPVELQEEPAKTPVSVSNTDVFNKFRNMEQELTEEVYDFKKGRAA